MTIEKSNGSNVSIVIPTFGDLGFWGPLADRAENSAELQTAKAEIIRVHSDSLSRARNDGALEAKGDWLIFLDASDELDPYYVEVMLDGTGDIRQPSTLGVVDGKEDDEPVLIPQRDLREANYLVIGSMVRRDIFLEVGGFQSYPILEDWCFFLQCWLLGASISQCPRAIYKVHVLGGSRNTDQLLHGQVYMQIRERYGRLDPHPLPSHLQRESA